MSIGKKIMRCLSEREAPLRWLAEKAAYSEASLSRVVATRKPQVPRLDAALRIARALGVPLEWLADDEQTGDPPPAAEDEIVTFVRDTFEAARESGKLSDQERELILILRRMSAARWRRVLAYAQGCLQAEEGGNKEAERIRP